MFEQIVFLRPEFLLFLIPSAVLSWRINHHFKGSQQGWRAAMDPALYQILVDDKPSPKRHLGWYFAVFSLLSVLALSGLSWQKQPVQTFGSQQPTVYLLDLSRSMISEDIKPDRLTRAKLKIRELLEIQTEGLSGMVVFAKKPYVITPLSDDKETLINLLMAVTPRIIPVQGADLALALKKSTEVIKRSHPNGGQIVLISDSTPKYDAELAVETMREQGIRLSVLAVGTEQGAPIPFNRGFLTDSQGKTIIAKTDFTALERLSRIGGGAFTTIDSPAEHLNNMVSDPSISALNSSEKRGYSEQWVDGGPWFLVPLVPLALLAFRRGVL